MKLFSKIEECELPEDALLRRYVDSGDYTDCFATNISRSVSLEQFVEAFYTTVVFKSERLVLAWFASRPSSDREARQLAAGDREEFAAWSVEDRNESQLLLSDYRGRTRSWLMVAQVNDSAPPRSRLYFGSAVVKTEDRGTGTRSISPLYRSVLGLHRFYSRVLLANAASRMH